MILTLKLFDNLWGKSCTMFRLDIKDYVICGESYL